MSENEQAQNDCETTETTTQSDEPEDVEMPENENESMETADELSDVDEPRDDIVERVEESDPEQLAREIESLRGRTDDLRERIEERESTIEEQESTIADLESSRKRIQAEFQNYKKRMDRRREEERKRATEGLVTRLVDVRDNLKRGLDQEGTIRDGVEATLRQFDGILEEENVVEIAPEPGDEVDPQRHEVLMRVESDQPSGTIDSVHRPGYEMAEKIVRTAQVTVSDEE